MQHKSSKCALIDNILALAKLMGIKNDKKINFKNHIDEICEKAGQKLNALSKDCRGLSWTYRSGVCC